MKPNVSTFIACDAAYEDAKAVIYGAPFDQTTSFRPGTRFASQAMRSESFGIETYSPYLDADLLDYNIMDAGDLELPFGDLHRSLNMIYEQARQILNDNKMPVLIGGEHLVTLPQCKAVFEKYPDLHIIHFDAHADLRQDYLGQELSHACVMRRCYEMVGENRIFQFGIRSGERSEFGVEGIYTNKFDLTTLKDIIPQLKGKPVYFTLDLDVLDPSVFPGTGTPEAGGVSFKELLNAVHQLSQLNVVAFDVNELSPAYDHSGVSTAVACKILREILLTVL